MIENIACMKDIVEFVSSSIKVIVDQNNKLHLETTSLYKIVESLSK